MIKGRAMTQVDEYGNKLSAEIVGRGLLVTSYTDRSMKAWSELTDTEQNDFREWMNEAAILGDIVSLWLVCGIAFMAGADEYKRTV